MAWLGVDIVGLQTRGQIDGFDTDAASECNTVLSLYPSMCASIYSPLIFLYLYIYLSLIFDLLYIFADLFRHIYIYIYIYIYIVSIYLFASILSLQPFTHLHLHIYQSVYTSTYYVFLFPYESTYLRFLSSSMFNKYVGLSLCLSIYLSNQSDLIQSTKHSLKLKLNLNLL